jgi:NADPH2:quinone reductase
MLAAGLGSTVLATAGTKEKCRACLDLGAVRAINYKEEDFVAIAKELTGGKGVDVILDMVGGDYLGRNIDCLAEDGRLAVIALLGGAKGELDLVRVLRKRLQITGSTLRPRTVEFKGTIATALRENVWPLIEAGKIKPIIQKTLPLTAAAESHRLLEEGNHVGKFVLTVD